MVNFSKTTLHIMVEVIATTIIFVYFKIQNNKLEEEIHQLHLELDNLRNVVTSMKRRMDMILVTRNETILEPKEEENLKEPPQVLREPPQVLESSKILEIPSPKKVLESPQILKEDPPVDDALLTSQLEELRS